MDSGHMLLCPSRDVHGVSWSLSVLFTAVHRLLYAGLVGNCVLLDVVSCRVLVIGLAFPHP